MGEENCPPISSGRCERGEGSGRRGQRQALSKEKGVQSEKGTVAPASVRKSSRKQGSRPGGFNIRKIEEPSHEERCILGAKPVKEDATSPAS